MKTTILLADAQSSARAHLWELLAHHRDFGVVGEAATDETTVVGATRLRPDIVLMEIDLSRLGDGFQAAKRLRDIAPSTSIVFHTGRADLSSLVQAIRVGAAGYVVKASGDHVLLSTLFGVARGHSIATSGLGPLVLEAFDAETANARAEQLSPREMQVLALLQRRMSNTAIAVRLGLRTATVGKLVREVVHKLDAGPPAARARSR